MNKLQLIQALKESQNLSTLEAVKYVDLFFSTLADALSKGDRVEIRDLCSFHVREYESYTGRNPKTGEDATVKAKEIAFFQDGNGIEAAGG